MLTSVNLRHVTVEDVDRMIRDYVHYATVGNIVGRDNLGVMLQVALVTRPELLTADRVESLVMPLLGIDPETELSPVKVALMSVECPVGVLAAACHCPTVAYRKAAIGNPSCPVEGQVEVALAL